MFIGDGPLRAELEHRGRARDLWARFLGAVDHDTVRRNLSEARVLCLPSVTEANGNYESFGMVLLEAQGSGVPVITSARSGNEVVRHEETGPVISEKDVDALAASLLLLLTNDDLAAEMAAAGPEYVWQNFDFAVCTSRIETTTQRFLTALRPLFDGEPPLERSRGGSLRTAAIGR